MDEWAWSTLAFWLCTHYCGDRNEQLRVGIFLGISLTLLGFISCKIPHPICCWRLHCLWKLRTHSLDGLRCWFLEILRTCINVRCLTSRFQNTRISGETRHQRQLRIPHRACCSSAWFPKRPKPWGNVFSILNGDSLRCTINNPI